MVTGQLPPPLPQGLHALLPVCPHYGDGHRCCPLTPSLSIHHHNLRQTNLTPSWQSHTNATSLPDLFWHQ